MSSSFARNEAVQLLDERAMARRGGGMDANPAHAG
mgnify:CR=1 FL=1